jgi:hypothetical protein
MNAYGKLNEGSFQRSLALMGEFPWTSVGYSSFSGAPSYSLETDVPMPKPADLEADPQSVEASVEETEAEPTVASPEIIDNTEEVDREIQSIDNVDGDLE